jgi:hypothetical protein
MGIKQKWHENVSWVALGLVMGIRGYDNEILRLHKFWGLLDDLSDNQLLKKDSIP